VVKTAPLEAKDETLVAHAVAGDRHAFATLLDRHYMLIYKIAYQWCGNQNDAEDITQDVCLKLSKAINSFDNRAKFTSWLYRIVLNMVRDMQRASARRNKRHADLMQISEGNSPASQEDAIATKELWAMVKTLPEKQCDAVLLVYASELNHAEAAKIMQVKESTVSWYIMEAKKSLKGLLKNE